MVDSYFQSFVHAGVGMTVPKFSITAALIAFSLHVLFSPLHIEAKEAPYTTSVGGGAYSECRKAAHLAVPLLLAGALIGTIVAVAIKKPSDPHAHSH